MFHTLFVCKYYSINNLIKRFFGVIPHLLSQSVPLPVLTEPSGYSIMTKNLKVKKKELAGTTHPRSLTDHKWRYS